MKKDRVNEVISSLADKVKRKKDARASPEKVMIKAGNEILMIAPDDILIVEKQDKVSLIHTGSNVYRAYQTLGELEEKLGDNFFRVHRSFIVNLNKVIRIGEVSNRSYEIDFTGYDKTALMSRYKFKEHKHRFTPL